MVAYPVMAAQGSKYVDRIFISTDSPMIREIGRRMGAEIINRPPELCTAEALGEEVFVHGYRTIRDSVEEEEIELIVLLFANAPTLVSSSIDQGIDVLRKNTGYDSAVTVSRYNMWSPLRARRIGGDGLLHPFVPFEVFGNPATLSCDRDSQGDVWFADMSLSVVRPRCLENLDGGLLPQKWMGQKIYPIRQWGGLDIDYEWQVPQAGTWLKKNGFTGE